MPGNFFLLKDLPYTIDQIHLGSLVPDWGNAHEDAHKPKELLAGRDYQVSTASGVDKALAKESQTAITAILTKVFALEHSSAQSSELKISSLVMKKYSLSNPKTLFDEIASKMEPENGLKRWLGGVSHRVGLRVYDPGSIPSLTHSRLVRTRLSAHNASRERYRFQFP
jgi:hypothetical protein